MWETICDAQAGFWLNSKFWFKILRVPHSQNRAPPSPSPSPENWNLGRSWQFEFWLWLGRVPYPPPPSPRKLKFSTLSIFSFGHPTPPPPPKHWNLAISWHFEYFQFWHPNHPPTQPPTHPKKLKFIHFLALWVFSFLVPTPLPPNWNLAISWHFEYFHFWHLPPPPNWDLPISWHFEYFQFWHPTPTPKMKNFRFEITKVYSGIAPLKAWNAGDRMWRLICTPPPGIPLVFYFGGKEY